MARDIRRRVLICCLAVDAAVLLSATAYGVGSALMRVAVLVSLLSAAFVAIRLGRQR